MKRSNPAMSLKNDPPAEELMESFADHLKSAHKHMQYFKNAICCMEWDLIRLKEWKETMDKQIHKIEKDLKKGTKDTKKLLKMDKKFDAKLVKCGAMKKKK